MDDTFKSIAFGFLGFAVFHGCLEARAHQDIKHQVEESFHHTGKVEISLQPRGVFGLYSNDIYAIDVYGEKLQADALPFGVVKKRSWQGSIQHLRLHYHDFRLRSLHIDKLDADIPKVKYDVGEALRHEKLLLRGSGTGPASVGLKTDSLALFITKKYPNFFSDLNISLQPEHVLLTGKTSILGLRAPFKVAGHLIQRDARFIDLVAEEIELNGIRVMPQTAQTVVNRLNPVLDIDTDLGLKGIFTIGDVQLDTEFVTIRGKITFPILNSAEPVK